MFHHQLQRGVARASVRLVAPGHHVCFFCCARLPTNAAIRRGYAVRTPARAPSTKRVQWQNRPRVLTGAEKEVHKREEAAKGASLPRPELIQPLLKGGLIKTDLKRIMDMLAALNDQGARDARTVKRICDDFQVPLEEVAMVARICLLKSNTSDVNKLGKELMLAMSANHLTHATIYVLRAAIHQDPYVPINVRAYDSPELAQARSHLDKLVAQKHPAAMVLQAQVYQSRRMFRKAIALLEEAIKIGIEEKSGPDADTKLHDDAAAVVLNQSPKSTAATASVALGYLQIQVGNPEGAHEAFKKGALEGDDPEAYSALAGFMKPYGRKWLQCQTKAAASGVIGSAFKLGTFYSLPLDQIPELDLREEMRLLETNSPPVWWRYRYLAESQRLKLRPPVPEPPVIMPIGSLDYGPEEWDIKVVNARRAMALEWLSIVAHYENDAFKKISELIEAKDLSVSPMAVLRAGLRGVRNRALSRARVSESVSFADFVRDLSRTWRDAQRTDGGK